MQKLLFISSHYLALFAFLISAWGLGVLTLGQFKRNFDKYESIEHSLVTVLGVGVFVCELQILSILGFLNIFSVLVLFTVSFFFGLVKSLPYASKIWVSNYDSWARFSLTNKIALLLVVVSIVPSLLKPLAPPTDWDEVMYHLPHARQWVLAGHLSVNEWLRYPWFPYNYELLYSATMLLFDDVMTHLMHTVAGWITAFMLYKFCVKYFNFWIGVLSVIIWMQITKSYYGNAMIDMGLSMFIFSSGITFYFWLKKPSETVWLYLAAFFMGVAVGSKYQALLYVPIFFVVMVTKCRGNIKNLMLASIFFLLPCIYWYARNAILTGDPFNPMGGKYFGFTDWNLGDFQIQFGDLKNHKDWPTWLVWTAPIAFFAGSAKDIFLKRAILVFCSYAFITWLISSHYSRYLLPAMPALVILASIGWLWLFNKLADLYKLRSTINYSDSKLQTTLRIFLVLLIIIGLLDGIFSTISSLKKIATNENERDQILTHRITGYDVLQFQSHRGGKTYQFGLEDSIYYAQYETWGDHFGPGRYRDFANLTSKELSERLTKSDFEDLIVHTERWPNINTKEDFSCYFSLVYKSGPVELYKISRLKHC